MTTGENRSNCPDNPIEHLAGEKITSVYFQGSTRLDIGLDPSYLLRIEGQCVLDIGGERYQFPRHTL